MVLGLVIMMALRELEAQVVPAALPGDIILLIPAVQERVARSVKAAPATEMMVAAAAVGGTEVAEGQTMALVEAALRISDMPT